MYKYTVALTTMNGEEYLQEFLDSLENQTVADWDLVVYDEASTDGTADILKEFRKKLGKDRVHIHINKEPSGSAKNNFAKMLKYIAKRGESRYILTADQDDIWMRDKIELLAIKMDELEAEYNADTPLLVHGDLTIVDKDLNVIADSMMSYQQLLGEPELANLVTQNSITGCAMMINDALLQMVAPFLKSNRVIMHDYFCALCARTFGDIGYVNVPVIFYRQHEDNSVGAKGAMDYKYLTKRLKEGKKEYRKALKNTMYQAGYFYECFMEELEDYPEEAELIEGYASLVSLPRKDRKAFYKKYGTYKHGLTRRASQALWG